MAKRTVALLAPALLALVIGVSLWLGAHAQAQHQPAPPAAIPTPHSVTLGTNSPAVTALISPTPALTPTRVIKVPILMYHHVGNPNTYPTYSVDNAMFEWQMDYLEKKGYHAVSVDDIAAALIDGAPLPTKPIAITFDDGWVQQITNTLPVLLRHHLRATYYIIVNVTGRRVGNMTWEQVRQLRDAGMWIGSHTLSHGYLPGMSDLKLTNELSASKRILEDQLGMPITTLAYPGGAFNARVEQVAQAVGYRAAVTVRQNYLQSADGLYRLQRVGVYGVDTQERFIAKIEQTFFTRRWPIPLGQAQIEPTPEP